MFFYKAVAYTYPVVYVTGFGIVLARCMPFMGNGLRNYQGPGYISCATPLLLAKREAG